ncbi:MAG TPA: hypothetical protein PK566_15540 [Pseudobacteroides sp.]|nr:hypothetical protein [Pseudobacteroides sp.]
MSKKQYKQFKFEKKEDYIFVLFKLIIGVVSSLEKYKQYSLKLEKEVKPYLEKSNDSDFISAETYETYSHILHDISSDIIKQIADMQDSSMSYKFFRKIAEKKGSLVQLPNLDDKIVKEMNELLDVRNWSFHNPQSLLVAEKEMFDKSIHEELRKYLDWNHTFNPIKVIISTKYNICYLVSLYLHTTRRIDIFSEILDSMIRDYSSLLGKKASYEIHYDNRIRPFMDSSTKQIQLSMAIQKGKYIGTKEEFNKITFNDSK